MLTSLSDEIVPTQLLDAAACGAALASVQREARASKWSILGRFEHLFVRRSQRRPFFPSYTTSNPSEGTNGPVESPSDRGGEITGIVGRLRVLRSFQRCRTTFPTTMYRAAGKQYQRNAGLVRAVHGNSGVGHRGRTGPKLYSGT